MPTFWLSWNSARLLALILNALGGLFDYYHQIDRELILDEIFMLSLAKGYLNVMQISLNELSYHKDIVAVFKNLSEVAHQRLSLLNNETPDQNLFLKIPNVLNISNYQKVDERNRWMQKNFHPLNDTTWFNNNYSSICLTQLFDSCNIGNECSNFLKTTGLSEHALTHQVLYLTIAEKIGCSAAIEKHLISQHIGEYRTILCTNMLDEIRRFQRDKKRLARIEWKQLELLMEQDACHPHTTVVAMASLLVFLHFLINPSPWPEFHLSDKLMTVDQIVSEDRFRNFRYIEWVKDAHFPPNIRLPKPPPMAWSPDLIAFMALLFIVVVGGVLAHHIFSSNRYWRAKQMYHFSYKKL